MGRPVSRLDLLKWVSAQTRKGNRFPYVGAVLDDPHGPFDPTASTVEEIEETARSLGRAGFVRVVSPAASRVRVMMEEAGEHVVEDGSFSAWSAAQHGVNYVANINAPVSGNVGVGHTVRQEQVLNVTSGERDLAQLAELLRLVTEAATGLEGPDRAKVDAYLGHIATEARDDGPDESSLRHSASRLKTLAGTVGNTALKTAVANLVTHLGSLI